MSGSRRDDADARAAQYEKAVQDLTTQVTFLEEEIGLLRRKTTDSPRQVRVLEERLLAAQQNLASAVAQNDKLVATLREAREQIVALKEEVDRLAQPPSGFGIFLAALRRRHHRHLHRRPQAPRQREPRRSTSTTLRRGQEVMLNEAMNVVAALEFERQGEVVLLKEILDDERARSSSATPTRSGSSCSPSRCATSTLRAGDSLLRRAAVRLGLRADPEGRGRGARPRRGPRHHLRATSAACAGRSSRSATPSSCRSCTPTCSPSTSCKAPKGILLYGPPGLRQDADRQGGRQLAGQEGRRGDAARARGAAYFLNIKGPELLNKYVGETERQIRLIFQRAREKAAEGTPVIVFFDEMDSIFRTRGSGVSSDVENTIVPQLLVGDRRRRDARERHRHRRVEPRGHDRPGDPAARPAGREDQDRAPRRRVGAATSSASTSCPSCRSTRTTSTSTAATARRPARR